jgi:thioredoxin reductase (NADPH)
MRRYRHRRTRRSRRSLRYVEEGKDEVMNPFTGSRHLASTLGPTWFTGEISFLYGGSVTMPMRAVCDTRVIEVPRADMLRLMSEIPEMSDIIIIVLAAADGDNSIPAIARWC